MKKIILLFGYVMGVVVGSKFAAGKKKTNTENETLGDLARDAGEEVVAVHKRLLEKAKKEYWTEENKQFVFEKKNALMMFVDDFKAEAKERMEELKEAGVEWSDKGEEELRKIYENRSEYLKKASTLGKQALSSAQEKLDEVFDDIQENGSKKLARISKKAKTTKKKVAPKKKK